VRRLATRIGALCATACLALGYALALPWYAEALPLGCALAWLLAGRRRPGPCLAASVLVAAAGILLSAPVPPMVLGLSLSLGLWDFERAAVKPAPGEGGREAEREALRCYGKARLPALALALGSGTAAAVVGSSISLGIPFFAMLGCAIACAVGLDRLAARLGRND
jgi:hypothetical protein